MKDANKILMKFISTQGYKNNSPDVNNPVNVIPSNRITMKGVDFPVRGVDNLGNSQMMMPGGEYLFGGDYVVETPMEKGGEMIKRADGSYSKRGLWDNIRDNKGSGKKPTKEMLEQERKINAKAQKGGRVSIPVTDRNDPRLKNYSDSLSAFNTGTNLKNKLMNFHNSLPSGLEKEKEVYGDDNYEKDVKYNIALVEGKDNKDKYRKLRGDYVSYINERLGTRTSPMIDYTRQVGTYSPNAGGSSEWVYNFKKPEQPYYLERSNMDTIPSRGISNIDANDNASLKPMSVDSNQYTPDNKVYVMRNPDGTESIIDNVEAHSMIKKGVSGIYSRKVDNIKRENISNPYDESMAQNYQTGGSTGEADLMTEYARRINKNVRQFGDKLLYAPFVNKAADMAEAKGFGFGEDNEGPLDAVRHVSSAASVASNLPVPSFMNEILPGSEQKIREYGSRALGALYEMYHNNPEGREMDFYNNKIGAQIGSIPGLTDEQRLKLINNALMNKQLQIDNMKRIKAKQEGGEMQQQNMQPQQQAGPDINDALGEISMMLENGTSEEEIMDMMIAGGISQEEASSFIESAKNDVEESDIEEEDADLESDDIEDNDLETVDGEVEDDFDDMMSILDDDAEMKYGGIKINPKKKGTFKAQATRMGMSVQGAATHILSNKEEYSPAMVKKANFAKNFAKELGGQMYEMASGGTVPDRYKNMGFTKVGVKKQSTRPGKKWMVLAKKDDKYKVVHGGWKGMKDFSQHGSEKRQDRFWDRMGGRDSAKAKDPFSPLYWHKRFGTWAEGGEPLNAKGMLPGDIIFPDASNTNRNSMYDYENYRVGDQRTTKTESNTIGALENNAWNRGLAKANVLGDPRSMVWALPNKGLLGKIKGIAGATAGLSGAILGYEKLFADPKTTEYIVNPGTKESGTMQDVTNKRKEEPNSFMKKYSQPSMYQEAPIDEMRRKNEMLPSGPIGPGYFDSNVPLGKSIDNIARYGGSMKEYQVGGQTPLTFDEWMAENNRGLMGEEGRDMNDYQQYLSSFQPAVATSVGGTEVAQTPGGAAQPGDVSAIAKQSTQTVKGDRVGMMVANNALAGLGMANEVLGAADYQKEYEQRLRETGNTMNRYNPQNAINPFGNYTLNAGPASNFALVANTPIQDFGTKMSSARYGGLIPFIPATRQYNEGGEFYADEDEIKRILAMGGEIEYLD
jgi:hypothetical protein